MLARYLKSGSNEWYGRPAIKITTGANPAANVECSDAVPAGKLWVILTYAVTMVQGITQTPLPRLEVKDATGTSLGIYPGMSAAMNASVTSTLLWGATLPLTAGGAATSNTGPIPLYGIILPEGSTIVTNTTGIGANSNYGAPIITAIEYSL